MIPILGGHGGTGGIGHRAGAEQNQAVDVLCLELLLQSLEALRAHPGEIGPAGIADPPIVAAGGQSSMVLPPSKDAKIAQ